MKTHVPATLKWIPLALIILLMGSGLLFFKGITPSFSSDDYVHLCKNIQFDKFGQVLGVFFQPDGREYRPLVRLSLWLNYQIGNSAIPFHATNLLLHLACVLCLFFVFFRLLQSGAHAFWASLVFALIPIHSTNVNFIMGRTSMLCALFYFLSVLAFLVFLKKRKVSYYLISLVFFVLALFSKEEAISLPLLLLVIMILHADNRFIRRLYSSARQTVPFFLVLLGYLSIRLIWLAGASNDVSVYSNFALPKILGNYAKWAFGLVYPFDLYQARWILETRQLAYIFIGAALFCGMAGFLVYAIWPNRRKLFQDNLIWLGFLWFIITLMPIMGGNPHRWYLYIPSASLSMIFMAIWRSCRLGKTKFILGTCFFALVICYSFELYKQSDIWAKQSIITENFMHDIKANDADHLPAMYFLNVPFGYKSAFLFTFESLQDAMLVKFGNRPRITILSFVNLDDDLQISSEQTGNQVAFSMTPNAYAYFIFPGLRRTFPSAEASMNIGGFRCWIKDLSPFHTVKAYEIALPEKPNAPFFYFDGRRIHPVRFAREANDKF